MSANPLDVNALRGRADRELPALYQLFGGYFHQDWKLEYSTWQDAVAAFSQEAPAHLREDATAEIARVLAAGVSDADTATLLYPVLQCNFVPAAAGMTPREWLRAIAERLR